MTVADQLKAAYGALRQGNAVRSAELVEEFSTSIIGQELSSDDRAVCEYWAARITETATAAMRGLDDAEQQMQRISRESRSIATYDNIGAERQNLWSVQTLRIL